MKPKGVLFDFDGALVNTPALYELSYVRAFESAGYTDGDRIVRLMRMDYDLDDIVLELGIGPDIADEIGVTRLRLHMTMLDEDIAWYPDAEQTVDTLIARALPVALVTNATVRYLDMLPQSLKIRERFGVIVGREHTGSAGKPHPMGLLMAADQRGMNGRPLAYVGDRRTDMIAAKAANMSAWHIKRAHTDGITALMAHETRDDMREFLKLI